MLRLHSLILLMAMLGTAPMACGQSHDSLQYTPNPSALKMYFDSIVPAKMEQHNVPGMVAMVVSNDSILFAGGYGYADREEKIPADPYQTVWRVASISKTVTATAVMQLVQDGKLDLNRNVNEYLTGLQIPEKFGKPVTLKHLLTHTAGFDDRYLNKSFRTREEWPPLKDFISDILPQRLYPPGKIYSYSNIGNALTALVVEEITAQDFNTYCRENIFLPLGMERTSFRVRPAMEEHLYKGYSYRNGTYHEIPFDYLGDYPAGQLLSPAHEFARFMICHLNEGKYDTTRILSKEITRQMHITQFTHHHELNGGIGWAFHLDEVRGNKVSQHGGGYMGLQTRMHLLPGQNTGIFMACNVSGTGIMNQVYQPFMKKFFNNEPDTSREYPLTNLPDYDTNVEKFTGYYRGTRYTHEDFTKAFLLSGMFGEVKLWKNNEGMLMMYDHKGDKRRLIQTKPGFFQSVDDDYHIAFELNKKGEPEFLFTHATVANESVPAFYATRNQKKLLMGLLVFFLLVLLGAMIYRLLPGRWKRRKTVAIRKMRRMTVITAALFLLYWLLTGLVLFVMNPAHEVFESGMAYGMPPAMYGVQTLPLLALVGLLILLFQVVRHFRSPHISTFSKALFVVFILASGLYLWVMNYWNLLGFHFG